MKHLIPLLPCLASLAVPLSAATSLGVREPSPPAVVSSQVPIELSTTNAVVAMQADVLFDENLYVASQAAAGEQPEGVQVSSRVIEPGRLRVVVHHRSNGTLESDVVFNIPLTARTGVVTDDPVVLTNIVIAGQGGGVISSTILPKVRLVGLKGTMNGRLGIEFSANATATAGSISRVEYYVGGVLIGEGVGPGFRFLWSPPTNGPFQITAVAYDSHGQQASTRDFPLVVTHVGTYEGAVLGNYFGLVRGPQFSFANDGYVTMTSTTKGNFTLKLLTGGKTWSSSGKFDADGNATVTISRGKGITPLTLVLAHSSTPPVDQIHGRVADGTFAAGKFNGNTFETEFTVDRVVWKLKTREAPQSGPYTLLLPAADEALTAKAPLGTGHGGTTVGKNGSAKLAASLADGTSLTASSFISKDGYWPVYGSLYKGKGLLMGALEFARLPGVGDLDGVLTWFRPQDAKAAIFKDGFLTEPEAVGARYVKPLTQTRLIPLANSGGHALLHLLDGGLSEDMQRLVTLSTAHKAHVPLQGADQAKLTVTPGTGVFSGSFLHPFTQKNTSFKGVVLQEQNLAAGYFLAGAQGGEMRFAANPALPAESGDEGPIGGTPLPVVKISAPANNSTLKSVTGSVVQIRGTATDRQGIAAVRVQVLHDGILSEPVNAVGTSSWTHDLAVPDGEGGHYTIFAKAVDTTGDESEIMATQFWTPLKSDLVVAVNGPGKVSKGFLGNSPRDVGKLVSITATPDAKKKFLGWTGAVVSSSPKITVLMKPGTALTANFGD